MSEIQTLALTEYSSKYGVSISTLRRRIKADQVEYVLKNGKYLLKDQPLTSQKKNSAPIRSKEPVQQVTSAPPQTEVTPNKKDEIEELVPEIQVKDLENQIKAKPPEDESSVSGSAKLVLDELKRAYRLVLQEKEEQIIQLKDEVADLKTLVRVLEDHNVKLKAQKENGADSIDAVDTFDLWLEDSLTDDQLGG